MVEEHETACEGNQQGVHCGSRWSRVTGANPNNASDTNAGGVEVGDLPVGSAANVSLVDNEHGRAASMEEEAAEGGGAEG